MKERLLHILDNTACLNRRQMKDYLAGTMLPEEVHAAEAHIASCPLCNMALEGFEAHREEALPAIDALNSSFLKKHLDAITPQIHLNSLSPATVVSRPKKKAKTVPLMRLVSVAALVLLAIGAFWYFKYGNERRASSIIAQNEAAGPAAAPETITIADSTMSQPTTASRSNTPSLDKPAPIVQEAPKAEAKQTSAGNKIASQQAIPDMENDNRPSGTAAADAAAPPAATVVAAPKKAPAPAAKPILAKEDRDQEKSTERVTDEKRARRESGPEDEDNTDALSAGNEHFESGRYSAALRNYRTAMANASGSSRSQAAVMAARCYLNLGQKGRAISLLEDVAANGSGPQKRQARRLLRDLKDE
jgi:FimV-like protein